jgi:hypothetical protein
MATARELLEQADALMRRNRKRGKERLDGSTLTGVLEARGGMTVAPTVILPDNAGSDADAIVLERVDDAAPADTVEADARGDGESMPLDTLGDVPILTDVVSWPAQEDAHSSLLAELEMREPAPAAEPMAADDAFPASEAEAAALADHAPTIAVLEREPESAENAAVDVAEADARPAIANATPDAPHPDSAAPASGDAGPFLDDDFILEIPPVEAARETAPAPVVAAGSALRTDADWQSLAEEVRMQVLQRLDLFTDTGLREQLGARLSPIVERASAELIETINRELGELVRGYVAEAIEREIESWRSGENK